MKYFLNYLLKQIVWMHQTFVWLTLKAWPFWLAIFLLAVLPCTIVLFSSEKPEDYLRYYGLILELLGICTVVLGLKGRWKLFGISNFFHNWKKQRPPHPKWKQKPKLGASESMSGGGVGGGSFETDVWNPTGSGLSADERLTALIENVETLRTMFMRLSEDTRKNTNKLTVDLDIVRNTFKEEIKQINSIVRDLGAGGIHVELMGVYLLTLGLIFSTVPDELACFLNYLF